MNGEVRHVLARDTVHRPRVKTKVREIQLIRANIEVRSRAIFLKFGIQFNVVSIDREIRSVITAGKRRPIVSLQRTPQLGADQEIAHRRQLLIFGLQHSRDHLLYASESDRSEILPQDLPNAPGGALQSSSSVVRDGLRQTVVLVSASCAVTASARIADIAIVKLSPSQAMKDVALVENLRAPVRQ